MNIIWKQPSGNIAITTLFEATCAEQHAKELQKRGDIPGDWELLSTAVTEFPQKWSRQEDWRFVDGKVVVDLDCARKTTKDRLRFERAALLQNLDVKFQRAIEESLPTDEIIREKRRLRDVTNVVDDIVDLEVLASLSVIWAKP